jgi:hypothetical protein
MLQRSLHERSIGHDSYTWQTLCIIPLEIVGKKHVCHFSGCVCDVSHHDYGWIRQG